MNKIWAFDLGSNMAVAGNTGGHKWTRTISFPTKDSGSVKLGTKTKAMNRPQRASATLYWIQGLLMDFDPPDIIMIERPFARGMDATRSLWGLAGIIEACFGDYAAIMDASPAEIKKHCTGDAKADKDTMTFTAQMLGYEGDNEHEADAYCALTYAEDLFTVTPPKD